MTQKKTEVQHIGSDSSWDELELERKEKHLQTPADSTANLSTRSRSYPISSPQSSVLTRTSSTFYQCQKCLMFGETAHYHAEMLRGASHNNILEF